MRFCALALCLFAGLASAAPPDTEQLKQDASRAFGAGEYEKAARLLEQLLEVEPLPTAIFNLGRAWDQAGEPKKAIEAFRRYVSLPATDTKPQQVEQANKAMDRLRVLIARDEANKHIAATEKERLEGEVKAARERADAEAEAAMLQREALAVKEKAAREEAEKKTSTRKIIAWSVGGVGLAALGTSAGLAFGAQGAKNDYRAATTLDDKQALRGKVETLALVTDVMLAVGVAAVVTAVVLYPGGDAAGAAQVGLSPLPGGGAVASLGGRF